MQSHRRDRFLSFITGFAILGVTLGTAALIITLSILDGFEQEIKEKVIGFTSHIEVVGFQNIPLAHYRQSLERVRDNVPGVKSIAPYAAKEGMIRSRDAVDGVFLKGIDPSLDVSTARTHLIEGKFLSSASERTSQIIIGRKLANRLNVGVGDKLVVFALPAGQGEALQPRAMQFLLVGIYESGMAEFDDVYAYTRLEDAQKLFQLGDNVTGYEVLVNDINEIDLIAGQVQETLHYPHYTQTVFQLYRNLFSWAELQKKLSPILLSLIIVVATINSIGTLLMFVLEKIRAIAVLKALGATQRLIRSIFILQGLVIATFGVILGNLLAFGFCWVQMKFQLISLPSDIYYMSTVPISLKPANFVLVTAAAMLLCLLTTLLPSRAAAKLDPVTAFRFG
ncbi:MAG: ABC transporter permease [Ignavibacteriae bacterium]|nr:ABC transporter permease [Ignavibacteria bacterium]MBI3365860.1 ABC transporter permease [Ignavibacteriota bacterium]